MAKELNIGDYVRTDTGIIEKIEKIYKQNETTDTHIQLNRMATGKSVFILDKGNDLSNSKGEVIKSSPNIIDLIQVGDYVNSMPVLHKENDELICGLLLRYKEENIENIVTKEQFEAMKYKIGE